MPQKNSPTIAIITPALAAAKNGNWQTARRWSEFIDTRYTVKVSMSIDTLTDKGVSPDALIALHARRSANDVKTFAKRGKPIAVVLTGTDLYGDTPTHPEVKQSLELADCIVALQEAALLLLSPDLQKKTRVIYQSAPKPYQGHQRPPESYRSDCFDIAFIGHLRLEKDPDTLLKAFQLLADSKARLIHVGRLEGYAALFSQAANCDSRIELKGALEHEDTLEKLASCQLMVISSRMEGGANVIIEAINSQVPVLASRISGNVGLLGEDYHGYFTLGNEQELAKLMQRCIDDPLFLELLKADGQKRAALFLPKTEESAVLQLVDTLMRSSIN